MSVTIGILHPGEMGAAVGAAFVDLGHTVLWATEERSAATRERARHAGLRPVGDIDALLTRSDIVLSICPPDAALDVARRASGFTGVYVDANAIAPATALRVAEIVGAGAVDGGIIGPPPTRAGTTRLYLSGARATEVATAIADARIEPRVLGEGGPTAASALKMTYAAWTKGSAALLLAIDGAARAEGVADALAAERALSTPELADRLAAAQRAADAKGWRWEGEMRQIAITLLGAGQPGGFHEGAATIYARFPRS
ncbi:MAG: NAD(P)-dependent oxidoreductase [Solirubrobacterales bacterium]|nr:NAD(P)-dependent oxidoreductase [Solirubrobacterales bacterium]